MGSCRLRDQRGECDPAEVRAVRAELRDVLAPLCDSESDDDRRTAMRLLSSVVLGENSESDDDRVARRRWLTCWRRGVWSASERVR